jgi:hypothetical protein
LTVGDPEVVGTFANCLFQVRHDCDPFDDDFLSIMVGVMPQYG